MQTPPSPFQTPASPFQTPQRPVKPPSSKARLLAIPAVLLLGGATAYGCFVGFDASANPGDRDLVVTVDDLTAGMQFTKDPSRESLKRTWYIDGTVDVIYEYDGSEGKQPIYVSSQVTQTRSSSDADGQYLGMKLGASAVFKTMGENVTEVARDDLIKWGDKSASVLLTLPQGNVGNYFVATNGTKVVMVMFTGVFFDDSEALRSVLVPKLTKAQGAKL